jgi:hypothetical protein
MEFQGHDIVGEEGGDTPMKPLFIGAFALLVVPTLLASGGPPGPPPNRFELRQNIPNPFCANPDVSGSSATEIDFALPQQAEIRLRVWSPDTTAIVRTLLRELRQLSCMADYLRISSLQMTVVRRTISF